MNHLFPAVRRWLSLFCCALVAVLALGVRPAGAQAPAGGPVAAVSTPRVGLAPGDVVRVAIWREPDLSGEFIVDPNGVVTLPMIGAQRVTGVPFEQLQASIASQFRVNLRNPSIVVTPMRRVQILGEVNRPGLYNLDPTITLSGAVANASGANGSGDLRRIRIVRDGRTYMARVGANETLNGLDIRSGDQIFVGQKSWMARNSGTVVGAALGIPSVILTIITVLRGPG